MMAKTNYSYEKRQRELARKKKQEEKRARHSRPKSADGETEAAPPGTAPDESPVDTPAVPDKPAPG